MTSRVKYMMLMLPGLSHPKSEIRSAFTSIQVRLRLELDLGRKGFNRGFNFKFTYIGIDVFKIKR